MHPGRMSMKGFLGKDESLSEVLRSDDETVARLGLTHEAIADRIEYFIKAVNFPSREGEIIESKFLVGGLVYRGCQDCPWRDIWLMEYSNVDLFIKNLETGEQINFPGAIVHLIRVHHFYEGKQSPYRVNPEIVARVLGLLR